jgi:cGMP-dependent protein kinase
MKTAEIQAMGQMKEMAELYINEKNIMYSIEHPYIVSIMNTFKTREYLFFLMEFVDGMTLRKYLNDKNRKSRDLKEAQYYGGLLSSVLSYLQKKKIIHRDLKPDNLMLEYNGYIKVIDFGVAKDITGKDYTNTFMGTAHYMAPEIILGKNYNCSVDYWSLGIILYEMFYGYVPFGNDEKDAKNVYNEIIDKKVSFPSDVNCSNFNEFVSGLLQKNPKKRINSFNKVKSYKFFKDFDFDSLLNMSMKGYYTFEKKFNEKDLKYIDFPFTHIMKSNLFTSSGDLDEYLLKNQDEIFNDF